jgi:positive regulator of sigma E activity
LFVRAFFIKTKILFFLLVFFAAFSFLKIDVWRFYHIFCFFFGAFFFAKKNASVLKTRSKRQAFFLNVIKCKEKKALKKQAKKTFFSFSRIQVFLFQTFFSFVF